MINAFLRNCLHAWRKILCLKPQQKGSSEQASNMEMVFILSLSKGNIESVPVHRKCIDRYCHKKTIQKVLREKARSAEDLVSKPKRAKQPKFSFLQHCLFCGEKCDVVKDPKHGVQHTSAGNGETFGNRGLREAILVKKRRTLNLNR